MERFGGDPLSLGRCGPCYRGGDLGRFFASQKTSSSIRVPHATRAGASLPRIFLRSKKIARSGTPSRWADAAHATGAAIFFGFNRKKFSPLYGKPSSWLSFSPNFGEIRREWDSNPRNDFSFTRFPSVLLKPLGHLSKEKRVKSS